MRPRRTLLLLIAATGCGVVALATGGDGPRAEAAPVKVPRPNIVVVMTDDQDLRSAQVMQNVRRQLRRRGTTFENFFATFPLCCPSRATFLTGQYAHNHGVLDNGPPNGGIQAFDPRGTLPVSLRHSGYRTGYIGKYLNGYRGERIPPGWSEWYALMEPGMFDYSMNENGRIRTYGSGPGTYQTDVLADKATSFIRRNARLARPFFLTVSTSAPHPRGNRPPVPAHRHRGAFEDSKLRRPPSFNELDVADKPSFVQSLPRLDFEAQLALLAVHRRRLETLLAVDEAVGSIVDELGAAGELRNTLLIFTSDNGYLLGEHRLVKKSHLYEESVRVPMIIRGPGIPEDVRREQVTGNIDLAPTILDAADADPERVVDGVSLLPLATDAEARENRDILFENTTSSAVRSPRFMYAEHRGGERELYDLEHDPYQLTSLHDDPAYASVAQDLAERLAELRRCAGRSCR